MKRHWIFALFLLSGTVGVIALLLLTRLNLSPAPYPDALEMPQAKPSLQPQAPPEPSHPLPSPPSPNVSTPIPFLRFLRALFHP